jgi:hypothetical protein
MGRAAGGTMRIILCCELSDAERLMIHRMKQACRIDRDTNLVRTALWSLADEMGLEVPPGVFDLRTHGGSNKKPAHKRAPRTPAVRPVRHSSSQVQSKSHPWQDMNRAIAHDVARR